MAQRPLMLKDYLELDSCSEPFWWAPLQRAGGATVRSLLEAELGGAAADRGGWRLVRSRSKGALTRLSAVIKLLQFSADASADGGGGGLPRLFSRTFSKKLRRSFWKKRDYEKKEGRVMVRLPSLDEETAVERVSTLFCTSPVVSRCNSSPDLFADGKESVAVSTRAEDGFFVGAGEESRRQSSGSQEPEANCEQVAMDCPFEEEKEQLSPVSVMDFPYQDEDEDEAVVGQPSANSPHFVQRNINFERAKNQLLQKIQRFESLAANLDPVDLDHRFACTEGHIEATVHAEIDEEEEDFENEALRRRRRRTASALFRRLAENDSLPVYADKLLFDFFLEGVSLAGDCWRGTKSGCACNEELLRLAGGWVAGGGIAAEREGEVTVREMERCGGGWLRFAEDEDILAVEMTGGLVTWLTEELVGELLASMV